MGIRTTVVGFETITLSKLSKEEMNFIKLSNVQTQKRVVFKSGFQKLMRATRANLHFLTKK